MNQHQARSIMEAAYAKIQPFTSAAFTCEIRTDPSLIGVFSFVHDFKHYSGGIPLRTLESLLQGNPGDEVFLRIVCGHLQAHEVVEAVAPGGRGPGEGGRSAKAVRSTFESELKMLQTVRKLAATLDEKVQAYAREHEQCGHDAGEPARAMRRFTAAVDGQIEHLEGAIKELGG